MTVFEGFRVHTSGGMIEYVETVKLRVSDRGKVSSSSALGCSASDLQDTLSAGRSWMRRARNMAPAASALLQRACIMGGNSLELGCLFVCFLVCTFIDKFTKFGKFGV